MRFEVSGADLGRTAHCAPWILSRLSTQDGRSAYLFVESTVIVGLPDFISTRSCAAHRLFPHFKRIPPSNAPRMIQFAQVGHRRSQPTVLLSGIFRSLKRSKPRGVLTPRGLSTQYGRSAEPLSSSVRR